MIPKWNLVDDGLENLGQQAPSKWDCAPQDPTDLCAQYAVGSNPGEILCTACKPGYAFDVQKRVCFPATIKNCFVSILMSSEQCFGCQNNTYLSQDLLSCLPFPQPAVGKFANCLLMSVDGNGRQSCVQCTQGFTSYNGFCVSTPADVPGCLGLDKDSQECLACNVFDGWYSMTKDSKKCTKA